MAETCAADLSSAFDTVEEEQEEEDEPTLHPRSSKKRRSQGPVIRIEEGTRAKAPPLVPFVEPLSATETLSIEVQADSKELVRTTDEDIATPAPSIVQLVNDDDDQVVGEARGSYFSPMMVPSSSIPETSHVTSPLQNRKFLLAFI